MGAVACKLYCCCCDCVSGPDGCSSYLCCCKVGSGHTGFEKGGGDLATNTEQECNCCGCVGFETRKVVKHHAAPAVTGTAATMPGSQPAQGHHTGVGAAISNLVHPHSGAATQAPAGNVGMTGATTAPQYTQQTTGAGYPTIGAPTKTVT